MMFSSSRKSAIKKLKKLVLNSKIEISDFRDNMEKEFETPILPNRVTCNERSCGDIKCDILVPEIYSTRRLILYIHGGSFVGGSRSSWRGFCASLANITSSKIALPEFRLAPSHAFPAAIEDIQSCFRTLYTEEQISLSLEISDGKNNAEPEIILAADGSGAILALALLENLREKYRKSVRQVILFSPWLNLSLNSQVLQSKKNSDEVLTAEGIRRSSELYTYASNFENPFVSPAFITDESLKDFPPFFIQMGEKEMLLPDAREFQKKLQANGIECTLDVWKDMMFMFQMADEELPEAHLAIERVGKLITTQKTTKEDFFANYTTPVRSSLTTEA